MSLLGPRRSSASMYQISPPNARMRSASLGNLTSVTTPMSAYRLSFTLNDSYQVGYCWAELVGERVSKGSKLSTQKFGPKLAPRSSTRCASVPYFCHSSRPVILCSCQTVLTPSPSHHETVMRPVSFRSLATFRLRGSPKASKPENFRASANACLTVL